ncbi:MAG: ferrous iron transporter B [Lachnospiraceae bacterium]|nr:ferrous iron transporter B [Lachnospiraceae bacterium]
MRIAFAGNPNSGKTTMYNALTGRNEKVGNWAGVTVDKKESRIKKSLYEGTEELVAVDLPGAYSMSPFTSEESVTSDYIKNEKPDVIVNIVDATNLSRSLFFTTQILELGIPVVVALNKSDINAKKKTKIDVKKLSEKLGCPVFETVSTTFNEEGLKEVVAAAVAAKGTLQRAPYDQGLVDMKDKASVVAADKKRFAFVNKVVAEVETRKVRTRDKNSQDKIDAVLTHPIAGLAIFAVIMFLVFEISQAWVGPFVADALVGWLETFQSWVGGFFENANPLLSALLVDGVIGGVIAVIGFLPLVMVMYFLIALLEDCGYMARATVVLDPIFKKVGLSGKSVIPFVITIGCAVPGVMATRTIRNERERRATAMLAPFMPCGAKIPVISLFAGAFFAEHQGVISFVVYLTGIVLIFLGALLVNKITGNSAKKSYFIIELPEYKVPSLWRAFTTMCGRGWAYIVKAATIILVCNTVVQIMQTFTWSFTVAESADASILASIAGPFAYLLVPVIGVLSWQMAAAAVTGFIAKENVVATLAVCFVGLENLIDTEEMALVEGAGAEVASVFAITKAAALAYLMFNLYTPPCFAAIGAMNAEMKSAKWLWGGIGLQLGVGFTVGCLVFQFGTLFTTGSFGKGFVPGMIAIAVFVVIVAAMIAKTNKSLAAEKAAKQRA